MKDDKKPTTMDDLSHVMKEWSYAKSVMEDANNELKRVQKLLAAALEAENIAKDRFDKVDHKVKEIVASL